MNRDQSVSRRGVSAGGGSPGLWPSWAAGECGGFRGALGVAVGVVTMS